ncbi:hypothetical protein BH09ACT7_BH09ACT7_15130 [soil metagenome]
MAAVPVVGWHSAAMSAPVQTQILIDTGGLVVIDDGRRVNVIDRHTGGLATGVFVLVVLALVAGGFGVVVLAMGVPSRAVGAIFAAVGLVAAGVGLLGFRTIRRRRAQPLGSCRSVAVLDRKLGLFTVAGGALLPLGQVHFARRVQIGSSSPKLVAVTPSGTHVLKRGNPFDGGIGNADDVLNAAVRT